MHSSGHLKIRMRTCLTSYFKVKCFAFLCVFEIVVGNNENYTFLNKDQKGSKVHLTE